MSVPFSRSSLMMYDWIFSKSTEPFSTILQLVTVSSCSCSPSVFRNSGSISRVLSRSNPLMFSTLSGETWDWVHLTMGAFVLMDLSLFSILTRSASSTKSVLFSSILSAKATCSTASFSAPSGFSASRCCSMCLASTRVTMPSSLENCWTSSSTKKVWATGAGSARPVVSMTMPSSLRSPRSTRSLSLFRTTTRSWRTVQQMHPFIISMISSSDWSLVFFFNRASSMPTSPNSFSMIASFLPCCSVRMWFRRVVLPEPKNPVRMVTGTRGSESCSVLTIVSALLLSAQKGRSKGGRLGSSSSGPLVAGYPGVLIPAPETRLPQRGTIPPAGPGKPHR
mmetsp:Transcript_11717/g.35631  ORF Transcript_11717/g.35631 Transcript_11717/m.35631 type:complete len:337 (+) Transcript_11717:489-1499(+)